MIITMLFIHVVSTIVMLGLIGVLADWSCAPKEPQQRMDRGLMIVALVVPIGLLILAANMMPYHLM